MTNTAYVRILQSPVGTIGIGCSEDAALCLHIGNSAKMDVVWTLQKLDYSIVRGSHAIVETLERELGEYFQGTRKDFSIRPLFWGTHFQIEVWNWLCRVPYGSTLSYSELASLSGHPKAARAIGTAMGKNRIPIIVPCHRIIAADGSLGGYGCGLDVKKKLLQFEGRRDFL